MMGSRQPQAIPPKWTAAGIVNAKTDDASVKSTDVVNLNIERIIGIRRSPLRILEARRPKTETGTPTYASRALK